MKYFCLVAGLLLGHAASAQQWFPVAHPGLPAPVRVEVDLDSVHLRDSVGEAVIRVSYDAQRVHGAGYPYRSFIATAQFDCRRGSTALSSAAYFTLPGGAGLRVGADSAGRESGMPPGLLESLPVSTRQALLRATCAAPRKN